MRTFCIQGAHSRSDILVGESLENLSRHVPASRWVVVTDPVVRNLHAGAFPDAPVIVVEGGEDRKTLQTAEDVYRRLVEMDADRSTFLVGIGGGIVCDVAGFVASTFLRGIGFGFAPTTLLAQVDASVGGKNGVNLDGYKNLVGTFNQPRFVVCDPKVLETLPAREVRCGMAEIVKHAAIADAEMFAYLEANDERALGLDRGAIERLVYDSVRIKSDIVRRDEREGGERRKLNFGHTLGHALEKLRPTPHGEAVAAGMAAAAAVSTARGLLAPGSRRRLEDLLVRLGLPVRLPVPAADLLDAAGKDKKREGDAVHFVFLEDIGKARVEKITLRDLASLMEAAGVAS